MIEMNKNDNFEEDINFKELISVFIVLVICVVSMYVFDINPSFTARVDGLFG
jgi:hypothetical protein